MLLYTSNKTLKKQQKAVYDNRSNVSRQQTDLQHAYKLHFVLVSDNGRSIGRHENNTTT